MEVRALKGFLQRDDQLALTAAVAMTDDEQACKDYTLQLGIHCEVDSADVFHSRDAERNIII